MEQQQVQPLQSLQQNAVERAQRLLQNMRQHLVWSAIIILLVIALVVSFIGGYFFNWDWTAFNGGPQKVTITTTASGITTTTEKPISKTLWDWLQLLIVPVMLAIGGFWLNRIQRSREEESKEQRTELARNAEEHRAELARNAEEHRAELARNAEEHRAKLETQKEFMRRVRNMHATTGYARVLLNAVLATWDIRSGNWYIACDRTNLLAEAWEMRVQSTRFMLLATRLPTRLFHEGEVHFVLSIFISMKQQVCFRFYAFQERVLRRIKPVLAT